MFVRERFTHSPHVYLRSSPAPRSQTGLQVCRAVAAAVAAGKLERPRFVIAVSSVSSCNDKMLAEGADAGFLKWDAHTWNGWARK